MKDDILSGLKAKFDQYDLWDVAEKFYGDYTKDVRLNLIPEVRFEGNTLPTDDCFKTLVVARNAMKAKKPSQYREYFDLQTVKKLLQIPYTQIAEVVESICEFTDFSKEDVLQWYEKSIDMFFVSKTMVLEFVKYITPLFDEEICKSIFREAILLGVDETKRRIDGLIAHTGAHARQILYSLYVETPCSGFLFYPYYTDPVDAMAYLREHFDEETTARILISEPRYLYVYKEKAYHHLPQYHHDYKFIADLLDKYKF